MKFLSVCSGIEAASVAWKPLGWEAVAFSEIEKFPSAVLAHHWPNIPNVGDMTKYNEWKLNQPIDLLVGGTPCQSFSIAGLRQGLADPRGNLTLTFLALAAKFRPKWILWENVPGVLSDKTNAFGLFLAALGQCGYGYAYRVLDAQYFGVPQRRRRVFVVGYLGNWQRAAKVLFEPESLRGYLTPSKKAREKVASFTTSSFGGFREGCGTVRANGGDLGGGSETLVQTTVATAMQVRRLTPTECERLQGFPDQHTLIPWRNKPAEKCPDGPRYKALGNSMAVPVMRWLGQRIEKQLHNI